MGKHFLGVGFARTGTVEGTGLLNLFGQPAPDQTAHQVVDEVLKSKFPNATVSFEIPNASVGYEPGYGVAADLYSRGSRIRVIVMAAVKHDYALIATAAGPVSRIQPVLRDRAPVGSQSRGGHGYGEVRQQLPVVRRPAKAAVAKSVSKTENRL